MSSSFVFELGSHTILDKFRWFLNELLKKKLVDAVLVTVRQDSGNLAPALVVEPSVLNTADPFAPCMVLNSAKVISAMTRISSPTKKVAVVLRPCELRAVVELVKLKQASTENLVLIGVDCTGTMDAKEYRSLSSVATLDWIWSALGGTGGSDGVKVREACQICEWFTPPPCADLIVGLFGANLRDHFFLFSSSPLGDSLLQDFKLGPEPDLSERQKRISELSRRRLDAREQWLERVREDVAGVDRLLTVLSSCINCHNCKVACPLCYCRLCFFDSGATELEGDRFLEDAIRRGAMRMPPDTLLFHLGRISHISTSCVGCGMCNQACPTDVPVFRIVRLASLNVQDRLGYTPGRSLEEELPLVTFKEDELTFIGV